MELISIALHGVLLHSGSAHPQQILFLQAHSSDLHPKPSCLIGIWLGSLCVADNAWFFRSTDQVSGLFRVYLNPKSMV